MPGIGEVLRLEAPGPGSGNGPLPAAQVPAVPMAATAASTPKPSVATHTKSIGMIHPPLDIRSIIEKTAVFVAKNGVDFEKKIMANEQKNVKFNFLLPTDPYHAYYQHKIAEEKAAMGGGHPVIMAPAPPQPAAPSADSAAPAAASANKFDISQFMKPSTKELEPPEPEQFILRIPEGLSGQDLDIIKLTAQFVARNGKAFMTGLTSREHNSQQFSFLRPHHSLFGFFTSLSDAYFKILSPPDGVLDKLRKDMSDRTGLLERCLRRLEWERSQEKERQKAENDEEQERALMGSIDWQDAVPVETIDFLEEEDDALPAPVTLEDVIRRSKALTDDDAGIETVKEVEMEMDEEETQMVEEGIKAAARIQEANNAKEVVQVILPADEDEPPMRIVKNWKRPEERLAANRDPTKMAVSPFTGELIPVSEMEEHMRISLIDPKYKEQKDRMYAKVKETTLASDDEISRNIVGLARLRPDIFGTTEEEVSNAVKAEIEKKREEPKQVIWDGHSGSINRTASQAMAQSSDDWDGASAVPAKVPKPLPPPAGLAVNVPRPVQATIQAAPGPPRTYPGMPVAPMATMGVHPWMGPPVMQMQQPLPPAYQLMPPLPDDDHPPPPPDEPEPKRPRLDLVPEDQFAARFPEPIVISVVLPPNSTEGDKSPMVSLTLSVKETVAALKDRLAAEMSIPSNKQKLSGRPGFLRDNHTLAFYNLGHGEILNLSFRERGGKKK